MRRDVRIYGEERRQDGLVRATASLLRVEGGPDVSQQPVCGPRGLHLIELRLPLGEALLCLGCGLLGGVARLVHESHFYS